GSGNLVDAEGSDGNIVGVAACSGNPLLFTRYVPKNALGEGYGRTAWGVFFFGVMNFVQSDLVLREAAHDPCEILIDFEININADAEVRIIEKVAVLFRYDLFNLAHPCQPTGSSARDMYAQHAAPRY